MCFQGVCPQMLHPPTQELKKCRLIIQALLCGLFILFIFAIATSHGSYIFYLAILAYILYVGMSQFNSTVMLLFFILCLFETVQTYIIIIGLIQYSQEEQYAQNYSSIALFAISKVVFFPNGVIFGHHCYRYFKQYAYDLQDLGHNNANLLDNSYHQYGQNNTRNQFYMQEMQPRNASGSFKPFIGQGVMIG